MFKDTKAFSGFSVDDVQKARQFYRDVLGLEVSEIKDITFLEIAGGTIVTASITNEAVADLGLKAGSSVIAVVKASDVMIATD